MPPQLKSTNPKRRMLLGAAITGLAMPALLAVMARAQTTPDRSGEGTITVTLLGTGSPILDPNRFGPSTLVQAGGLHLLFDAGRGCTIRLSQLRVPLGRIDGIFLTHYHSDHLNGLPDLWMTGYLPGPAMARTEPLALYGPDGLTRLVEMMRSAFSDDVKTRMADEKVSESATAISTHEFPAGGGKVFESKGVTVTAFPVNHGDFIKPAVGFRIDYAGHSVLLSGDTRPDENVVRHGKGVDLLIHEVCAAAPALAAQPATKAIMDHHTTPEQAGRIFASTRPRLAAFTHIVLLNRPPIPVISLSQVESETRTTYDGPLVIGEDLTRFVIEDGQVRVRRWDFTRQAYSE